MLNRQGRGKAKGEERVVELLTVDYCIEAVGDESGHLTIVTTGSVTSPFSLEYF